MSSRNPLGDDRFGAMFESAAFEVDKESEEYARAHPTSLIANKMVRMHAMHAAAAVVALSEGWGRRWCWYVWEG